MLLLVYFWEHDSFTYGAQGFKLASEPAWAKLVSEVEAFLRKESNPRELLLSTGHSQCGAQ